MSIDSGTGTAARPLALRFAWPGLVLLGAAAMLAGAYWQIHGQMRLGMALGMLALVCALESRWVLCPAETLGRGSSWLHDLGHFFVGMLGEASALALVGVLGVQASRLCESSFGFVVWPGSWPLPLQCALALVAADGLDYASHRLFHASAWLWPIHALHHDIGALNAVKGARMHVLNVFLRAVIVYLPLLSAGAPVALLFWYHGGIATLQTLAHANLNVHVHPAVHRWLVTPQVHRIHHARSRSRSAANYGAILMVWDRCLGSYVQPDGTHAPVGIEGEEHQPASFLAQLCWPLRRWLEMSPLGSSGDSVR